MKTFQTHTKAINDKTPTKLTAKEQMEKREPTTLVNNNKTKSKIKA